MEVPCVDVPLDFLTTGVAGSRSSRDWAKSGSWRTCRLSFTALLLDEGAEGEGDDGGEREGAAGPSGRVWRREEWRDRGKVEVWGGGRGAREGREMVATPRGRSPGEKLRLLIGAGGPQVRMKSRNKTGFRLGWAGLG